MLKPSPLKRQYNDIKSRFPDSVLLFRVGDFYEAFDQDAVSLSEMCGTILTQRPDQTQLSGFPSLSLDCYLPLLVKSGKRVVIVDPLVEESMTKGRTQGKTKNLSRSKG